MLSTFSKRMLWIGAAFFSLSLSAHQICYIPNQPQSEDGSIVFFDDALGKRIGRIRFDEPLSFFSMTKEADLLIAGKKGDSFVHIIDLKEKKVLASIDVQADIQGIYAGKAACYLVSTKDLLVFDLEKKVVSARIAHGCFDMNAFAINAEESFACIVDARGKLHLLSIPEESKVDEIQLTDSSLTSVAFLQENVVLTSASRYDYDLFLVDLSTGSTLQRVSLINKVENITAIYPSLEKNSVYLVGKNTANIAKMQLDSLEIFQYVALDFFAACSTLQNLNTLSLVQKKHMVEIDLITMQKRVLYRLPEPVASLVYLPEPTIQNVEIKKKTSAFLHGKMPYLSLEWKVDPLPILSHCIVKKNGKFLQKIEASALFTIQDEMPRKGFATYEIIAVSKAGVQSPPYRISL